MPVAAGPVASRTPVPALMPRCTVPRVEFGVKQPGLLSRELPFFVLGCGKLRVFSQALLYHLVGNQIFPSVASAERSRITCVVLGQTPCSPSRGHPQCPPKGRAALGDGSLPISCIKTLSGEVATSNMHDFCCTEEKPKPVF